MNENVESLECSCVAGGCVNYYNHLGKLFFFLTYLLVCLFRATPKAYGGSQAKGQIGAVAAGPVPLQRGI